MFQIKQPDAFALRIAEAVDNISSDVLQSFAKGLRAAFRTLFYNEQGNLRPAAEVNRILGAFEQPLALLQKFQANVDWVIAQAPVGAIDPADYAIPLPYTVDPETGEIVMSDPPPIVPIDITPPV